MVVSELTKLAEELSFNTKDPLYINKAIFNYGLKKFAREKNMTEDKALGIFSLALSEGLDYLKENGPEGNEDFLKALSEMKSTEFNSVMRTLSAKEAYLTYIKRSFNPKYFSYLIDETVSEDRIEEKTELPEREVKRYRTALRSIAFLPPCKPINHLRGDKKALEELIDSTILEALSQKPEGLTETELVDILDERVGRPGKGIKGRSKRGEEYRKGFDRLFGKQIDWEYGKYFKMDERDSVF